jgi:hypothetical protein
MSLFAQTRRGVRTIKINNLSLSVAENLKCEKIAKISPHQFSRYENLSAAENRGFLVAAVLLWDFALASVYIKQNHKVELRVGRHKHTRNRKCVCRGGCCCCWCCKKLCRARQCKKRNTSLSAGLWHCSLAALYLLCSYVLFSYSAQFRSSRPPTLCKQSAAIVSAPATCLHKRVPLHPP